ncbi:MAG: hypothetical protein JOY77_10740 [Alphaproteobacteria bacterium]|nr:hypothetical protein [Alphaproteobacteria bacterium]MBV9063386.1 hypothetical protein [Alphaproteobacteria bacterium]
MSTTEHHHGAYGGAGLFIGGFAWTMSTVLGPAFADQTCAKRTMISGGLALAALVLAAVGALLSWRSSRLSKAINVAPAMPGRKARIFFAKISIMAAGLFALAILYQLAASGIFNGCER